MTGFATKTISIQLDAQNKVNMTVSIKSLNSRFFETTCKLPYALSHLETEFVKILKKKLHRGHIYFNIYLGKQELLKSNIEPSLNAIASYMKAIELIKQKFHIEGSLSLGSLLQLPDVFMVEEKEIDAQTTQEIFKATHEVIDDLIATKQEEGAALEKDLSQRITIMQQEISIIEQAFTKLLEEQKNKVNAALKEIDDDESKLAEARKNALYAILDKMDIHEEIVRFMSHLKSISDQLRAQDLEKGKRIDFTLQELAREINTISAKCSDASIGKHAINVKVEIEKAREQAQNIV